MTDYFTDHDDLLDNKLGISDPELLKEAETSIVYIRLVDILKNPPQGIFDFNYLKKIHKYLFSDIYTMAGKARNVNLKKDKSIFCLWNFIDAQQRVVFKQLKLDKYYVGLDITMFISKMVHLSSELNVLHPFREGNGRAIRCFLKLLSNEAGYDMDIFEVPKEELLAADIAAFNCDFEPLTEVYSKIIRPIVHE